jgi:hypothetical protein
MDFDGYGTRIGGYSKRYLKGRVGDIKPSRDSNIKVKYSSGFAIDEDVQMTHCSYDQSDCYKIRSIPAIT